MKSERSLEVLTEREREGMQLFKEKMRKKAKAVRDGERRMEKSCERMKNRLKSIKKKGQNANTVLHHGIKRFTTLQA